MSTPEKSPETGPQNTAEGPTAPAEPAATRARWRPGALEVAAIVVTALVLVGGVGAYVVGYFLAGDRLPKNAVVAGVPVGGLSVAAAEQKLTAELGERAAKPITVQVGDRSESVDPEKAGLTLDVAASVAQAGGGRSFDPRHIWQVLTGGSSTDAVISTDAASLDAAVAALATKVDAKAKDATLAYTDADDDPELVLTKAVDGVALDRGKTAAAITAGYLNDQGPIEAVAELAEPGVTTAEAEQVAATVARPAIAKPITLQASGSKEFEVTPQMIAPALTFVVQDGTLGPKLDAAKLHGAAEPEFAKAELAEPKDARVVIRDGKPAIVGGTNGVTITAEQLAAAVEPALGKTGDARRATVEASTQEPDFTRADAEKLGIKEVTGKFTTRFPYAAYRNHNIGRAGERINNSLVLPGKTFSLNKTLKKRTVANGYVKGYVIVDGRFRMELGGGVSQSATTTYNAAFFAGLQDVEHRPHGLYINRYPAGREATVYWPTVDLRFKNDTAYGVLVQATVKKATGDRQGSITVKIWSTKTYDKVRSSELVRSNYTSGPVIRDKRADCEPQASVSGFDVNYRRLFYRGDEVVKTEKFFWRYKPTSQVICV